jgi:hypothetical protein
MRRLPCIVCGSGSCSVRILKPFPERRTVVISSGEATSSRRDGSGSEWRIKEDEKRRIRQGEVEVRREDTVLKRWVVSMAILTFRRSKAGGYEIQLFFEFKSPVVTLHPLRILQVNVIRKSV